MSAWQPIETAPRDRRVLVSDGERVVVAQHMTSFTDGNEAWVYALDRETYGVSFEMPAAKYWQEQPPLPTREGSSK